MGARRFKRIAPLVGVALAVAGCGTSAASSGGHRGGAAAAITRAYEQFFNGKNGYGTKMSLLQNSYLFRNVVRAQDKYLLARQAHVSVAHVGAVSGKTAPVRFDLYEGKKVALRNEKGSAVKVAGTWKVSAATVCALLHLEGYANSENYGCPATPATGTTL